MELTRRKLFQSASTLMAGALVCPNLLADERQLIDNKTLNVYNIHTSEHIKATIWEEGNYQMDEIARLDNLMRDHRSGEIKPIQRDLYEFLFYLQNTFDSKQPLHIISGYRCQATNNMLRGSTNGVAKKSMHIEGRAIDLNIPRVSHTNLVKAALSMKAGGVGSYPKSGFVHIDNGRVRRWNG